MADIDLKGSVGSDAADGLSWAAAKATLNAALAAGSTVWCDKSTSESVVGSSLSIGLGSQAAPSQVVSGFPDAGSALASPSQGYGISVSGGTFAITITGWGYVQGVNFTAGSGTNNGSISLGQSADNFQDYSQCSFVLGGSGTSARINCGIAASNNASRVEWSYCNAQFAAVGQSISVQNCCLRWAGGAASGVTPTALFSSIAGRFATVDMFGVDLSALANTFDFVSGVNPIELFGVGLRLPAGWAGDLISSSTGQVNHKVELWDCDDANNGHIRFALADQWGTVTQETTTTITGAGDDLSDYSIKLVSSAATHFPSQKRRMHPQYVRNVATGAEKTLRVQITSDDATLTNKDVALVARFYGSSTSPLLSEISSASAVTLTAVALDASAQVWNNALAHTYELSVSFTPNRKGYIAWEILLFKPGTTIVVSPLEVVS